MEQLIVSGLAMGSIYALVALGFLLIANATGAINFAQGDMLMVAAYFAITASAYLSLPLALAYLAALLGMVVFGLVFQVVAYRPLRDKPVFTTIISTLAVGIFLRHAVQLIWGVMPLGLPGFFGNQPLQLGDAVIAPQNAFIIAVTLVLILVLHLFLSRSALGRMMRAVAQDAETARLMGIPVDRVVVATFVLSSLLAGVAGLLVAPLFTVSADMGVLVGIKAFIAAVIGGFGSIPGAIIGGLLLGLVEIFAGAYISSAWKDAVAFVILIVILFVIPRGIMGQPISEKV